MERSTMKQLEQWKNSVNRKTLILTSVRQCEKTWLLGV